MKRIIVFSDTHGNKNGMRDALKSFPAIDAIVHLGDGLADGEDVAREAGIPLLGVLGNEDGAADYPRERIITAGATRLLALHGDRFDISPFDDLPKREENNRTMAGYAAFRGAGLLLYGHSHRAVIEESGGVALCNPGDQYAGSTHAPSFCLLDSSEDGMSISLYVKDGGAWKLAAHLHHAP